jgi:hypothetical protein
MGGEATVPGGLPGAVGLPRTRIRPIYVKTRLYILNISKFHLSLNVFRLFMFEFAFSFGLAAGKMGLPRSNFTSIWH